jgi:hypothetical protein
VCVTPTPTVTRTLTPTPTMTKTPTVTPSTCNNVGLNYFPLFSYWKDCSYNFHFFSQTSFANACTEYGLLIAERDSTCTPAPVSYAFPFYAVSINIGQPIYSNNTNCSCAANGYYWLSANEPSGTTIVTIQNCVITALDVCSLT